MKKIIFILAVLSVLVGVALAGHLVSGELSDYVVLRDELASYVDAETVAAHVSDTNNPHAVTAEQTGAIADRVVQPMYYLTNGTISIQPDIQIYAATPESGTAFDVDLSAVADSLPAGCAITFEMLLSLGASVSNVTFMSTNTLSWLEGDAPAIPQGARSILVFRSYDLTNWVGNLQGILP